MIQGIYIITDEVIVPGRTHVDIARAAVEGGASVIQLRDKNASDEYMIEAGKAIRQLTRDAGVLFIVNDRLEVALACDADGLHVGSSDRPAAEIRHLLKGKILGVSAATLEEASRAGRDGADYIGVGPIFDTTTKLDAGDGIGLEMIEILRAESGGLPVVAIGGINASNLADVARAGADSASLISAVVCAPDMKKATSDLVALWKSSKSA